MYILLLLSGSALAQARMPLRIKLVSARITYGCRSDSEKVAKINHWISRRIKYDVKGFMAHRVNRWSLKKIMRRRKGLCREYAFLFDAMCRQNNITSLTVNGYSKSMMADESDVFFTEDHCWNIFKADNRWYLSDLTWASGYLFIHYSPLLTWQYRLHIRKFPFKLTYQRSFDSTSVFNRGRESWLFHHPNNPGYQLLKDPFELDEFENLVFRPDTLRPYFEKNKDNDAGDCRYCETQALLEENKRNYSESVTHLKDNPRNTFSYLHHFVAYDKISAEEHPSDTLFLKEEIGRYSDMMPFTVCTQENIQLDFKMNMDQVQHKNRLFRNEYIAPLKSGLYKNEKVIRSNYYFLRKSNRLLFSNHVRFFFKYRSLLLYRIVTPANKGQTLRDRRLYAKYSGKKDQALHDASQIRGYISDIEKAIDQRDSSIRIQLVRAREIYEMNSGIEPRLTGRMSGFEDTYDLGILQVQDSIISNSTMVSSYLNNVETEIRAIYAMNRRFIRNHSQLVNQLKKYKRYIIKAANHAGNTKPEVTEMQAADSIINNCYRSFTGQISNRKARSLEQMQINSKLKGLRRYCKKEMREQIFYHKCRALFEKHYYRTDRLRKKASWKDDRKYLRTKLKVLNKQLKKERRRALKELLKKPGT